MFYLKSVGVYFISETCEVLNIDNETRIINYNDIKSIDEFDDNWFTNLSDEDLGTIQNAINNRVI